jgi:hypothetical protein
LGQSWFIVSAVGVFVDDWFMKQVRGRMQRNRGTGGRRPATARPSGYGEGLADDDARLFGLGDFITVLVISVLLAVMADSFFFTPWLDLPPASGSSGASPLAVAVKITASVLALAVAVLAPVVLAVFAYLTCSEWLASRSRNPQRTGGCVALFPASLVAVAGYGHFYVAYLIYQSLGVLRPHG